MTIYFDACCVNRLTDDHGQERIRREAEAINELIGLQPNQYVGCSVVFEAEISRNPDSDRREDVESLLPFVKHVVKLNDEILSRARGLQGVASLNLTPFTSHAPKPPTWIPS